MGVATVRNTADHPGGGHRPTFKSQDREITLWEGQRPGKFSYAQEQNWNYFDGQRVLMVATPAGDLEAPTLTSWSLSLLTYKMEIIKTYFLGLL